MLSKVAEQYDRDRPDDDQPTQSDIRVILRNAAVEGAEPSLDNAFDVVPEVDHHRNLCADLGDRCERRPGIGRRWQELTDNAQVRARGDREKLRETLNEAEDDRLEKTHAKNPCQGDWSDMSMRTLRFTDSCSERSLFVNCGYSATVITSFPRPVRRFISPQ